MKELIGMTLFLLTGTASPVAQPYLDLFSATYWTSPGGGTQDNKALKKFDQLRVQLNLPWVMKKDSSILLLNPIYEQRYIRESENSGAVQLNGTIIWLTYTRNLSHQWSLMLGAVPRWNGTPAEQYKNGFQMGGAFLVTKKQQPGLQIKAGLYYNKEFFGNFFMPLAGIDWEINKKSNLFGIVPNYLIYERRISPALAWGGAFRTFTNSYRITSNSPVDDTQDYVRINDNQLGLFGDWYITRKIVCNLEAGHTLFREIRTGTQGHGGKKNEAIISSKDNFYAKASLCYRLRFD